MEWQAESTPNSPGWYAVLICWDMQEGVFPSAAYWDGREWSIYSVVSFGDRCDTQKEAIELGYENDPDDKDLTK